MTNIKDLIKISKMKNRPTLLALLVGLIIWLISFVLGIFIYINVFHEIVINIIKNWLGI